MHRYIRPKILSNPHLFPLSSRKRPVPDRKPAAPLPQASRARHFPVAFWALIALTAVVRLPGITRPLVGNFATKNVMYAMIARNWVEGRAGILYPTLDCLRGGERSLHMLEFSVSAYLTGALWKLFGGSLDVWGRSTAVAFSVASVAILFLMVRRWHGRTAALGAGMAMALGPVSIIYGQSFMLDASLAFFTIGAFYCTDRWLVGGRSAWLVPACLSMALLLLTKVYMVVLLLPLGVMVVFRNRFARGADPEAAHDAAVDATAGSPRSTPANGGRGHAGRPRRAVALVAAALAVLPVGLWCGHAIRTAAPGSPHAEHVYSCLQGNADAYRPPDPLLRKPDFYRQLLDDLTGVILTPLGFALLLAGFLDRRWRRHAAWLAAVVLLVLALPRKFYDMNYYYLAVLPPLCVMVGLGWQVVCQRLRPGRWARTALLFVALVLAMRYAAKPAFVTPWEDRGVVAAGRALEELTAAEEPVVTMHGTTIDVVYYTNRPGWVIPPDTPELAAVLDECRAQGARFLAVTGRADPLADEPLAETYPCVVWGKDFRVYQIGGAAP